MSRLNRYKHALLSGYFALGANALYTLASVPLALAYLNPAEFGLWAIVTQIGGYVALVDLGMSGSVYRILIDYKDDRADGRYGSTILTSLLVGLVQGALVLIVGIALALVGAGVLRVPSDLQRQFVWLLIGQSVLQAASFSVRPLQLVLTAWQRLDLINYTQGALLGINYVSLWGGFALGFGVYSSLWSQALVQLLTTAAYAWWCIRLKLLPASGQWGKPTRERFKEVFSFGADVFLFTVGSQVVNASQAILITPFLGLAAAGLWSVCTRAFTLVMQIVSRILDSSAAPLSELLVRREDQRFFERFRSITIITASVAVVGGVLFATCNQAFVAAWSKGRYGWPPMNDSLLAGWLFLVSVQRCHCGLLGVRKQLGTVKYVYFAEGCLFLLLAIVSIRVLSYAGLISSSIVATLCLSFSYGLRRTRRDFQLSWSELLGWLRPAVTLAVLLIPWAVVITLVCANLRPIPHFVLTATAVGIVGAALLLRYGLDHQTQELLLRKLPSRVEMMFSARRG
jgi:O-antigen/teichoic acid export membrane protein